MKATGHGRAPGVRAVAVLGLFLENTP